VWSDPTTVTSERPAAIESPAAALEADAPGGRSWPKWAALIALAVIANALTLILVPPFNAQHPDQACNYPVCFINGTLELPAPHVVIPAGHHTPPGLIVWDVSISSSLLTMWIIMAVVIVALIAMTWKRERIPGRWQNAIEALYEGLQNFGMSLGGPAAKKYIPLFVTLFIFILACNWSGLLPFVGRIPYFRAPTSDVNVTIGLALVSFAIFHIEGVRALGVGGYLSKFFPLREFRNGVGAGVIALFVGLVELMLEFVKPLTLSMRLFGNIYGGEVALGVILALTLSIVPLAIYGLELMLNTVQALIFSVLTLMFTLAAIEGHHADDEHHQDEPISTPLGTDELDEILAPAH
jgi:F-type H+-transporting ATPase subunit a